MAEYLWVTSSRSTQPDPVNLLSAVRAAANDALAGVFISTINQYRVKKTSAFSDAEIAATQAAIDTAPALTPQRAAQNRIDAFEIEWRALALALLDQINTLRANLPTPLAPITAAQALTAIRNKAAQLS